MSTFSSVRNGKTLSTFSLSVVGNGSHENGCPFKVVAMKKEVQTCVPYLI